VLFQPQTPTSGFGKKIDNAQRPTKIRKTSNKDRNGEGVFSFLTDGIFYVNVMSSASGVLGADPAEIVFSKLLRK